MTHVCESMPAASPEPTAAAPTMRAVVDASRPIVVRLVLIHASLAAAFFSAGRLMPADERSFAMVRRRGGAYLADMAAITLSCVQSTLSLRAIPIHRGGDTTVTALDPCLLMRSMNVLGRRSRFPTHRRGVTLLHVLYAREAPPAGPAGWEAARRHTRKRKHESCAQLRADLRARAALLLKANDGPTCSSRRRSRHYYASTWRRCSATPIGTCATCSAG